MTNEEIADQFSLLAKFMDVHGENSFKIKTYTNASFNIEKVQKPLAGMSIEEMKLQPGIGVSVSQKIEEILQSGRLKVLDDLLQNTPIGILEMMRIKGIGAKKIHTIWKEMEIETLGELLYACKENRLKLYKGFGEKTQSKIAELIEFHNANSGSHLYASVFNLHQQILEVLQEKISPFIQPVGDMARQLPVITAFSFLTTTKIDEIEKVLLQDSSFVFLDKQENFIVYETSHVKVSIYSCFANELVQKSFELSSSPEFNEAITLQYSTAGFSKLEDFFTSAEIQPIPTSLWEAPDVIEKAKLKKIPNSIKKENIKGLIHSHSTWSDGSNTVIEMAEGAAIYGLEYMLLTDHSKSAFYANGLNEARVLAQQEEIDKLNRNAKGFRIYKGIESDILNDGSLDYSDAILASFDCVIASIHSNLNMTEEKAMARLMGAIKNPYTSILGHMTGRLLLSRAGYPVNHKEIIDACAYYNVAIEINANPNRLDLDWSMVNYALEKNVLLSINPDAHSIKGIGDIQYGVYAAQKTLLTPLYNISSFSISEFEEFLQEQHEKRN